MRIKEGHAQFSRRRFVKAAAVGGAVAVVIAMVGLVRRSGYDLEAGARARLTTLEPWQYIVVRDLARRVCAPDRPGVVGADEADVAGFVDGYVARLPKRVRRDLTRFLGFVEHLSPVLIGLGSRFTRLRAEDQDRVLGALETSGSPLLRGGFEGLKALLFMGYYRDPRTWSVMGYEGPLRGA
jgi:hypothetical protein